MCVRVLLAPLPSCVVFVGSPGYGTGVRKLSDDRYQLKFRGEPRRLPHGERNLT